MRITHVTDGYFGRSLAEGMEANKVPGISITVVDDYEIEWARGFGVLSVDGNETRIRHLAIEQMGNWKSIFQHEDACSLFIPSSDYSNPSPTFLVTEHDIP